MDLETFKIIMMQSKYKTYGICRKEGERFIYEMTWKEEGEKKRLGMSFTGEVLIQMKGSVVDYIDTMIQRKLDRANSKLRWI